MTDPGPAADGAVGAPSMLLDRRWVRLVPATGLHDQVVGVSEMLLRHVLRPAGVSGSTWRPFEPTLGFNDAWWSRVPYASSVPHFVTFSVGSTEVGRVELDHNWSGSLHRNAPRLGAEALEVQLIEIVQDRRRQGLGLAVVRRLAEEFPDRRLLALSEEADLFWTALGWHRYDYGTPPHHYRPLFIEPAPSVQRWMRLPAGQEGLREG